MRTNFARIRNHLLVSRISADGMSAGGAEPMPHVRFASESPLQGTVVAPSPVVIVDKCYSACKIDPLSGVRP